MPNNYGTPVCEVGEKVCYSNANTWDVRVRDTGELKSSIPKSEYPNYDKILMTKWGYRPIKNS
jgi:hypothetical protein